MKTNRKTKKTRGNKLNPTQVKEVKKIIRHEEKEEVKHNDTGTGYAGFASSAASVMTNLTGSIAQGTTDSNRIGDQIVIRGLDFRYVISNNTGGASNLYNVCRVIVFQYLSSDMTPSYISLLNNDFATGTRTALSAYNPDYQFQYRVLYDKTHMLVGNVVAGSPVPENYAIQKHVKIPIKFANKKIQFQAGNSTNCSNGIWSLFITYGASVVNNPQFSQSLRTWFVDA